MEAIEGLAQNPLRHSQAREGSKVGRDLRQLLYRRYRSLYRIIFTVGDDDVRVLCIRHAARDDATFEVFGGENS